MSFLEIKPKELEISAFEAIGEKWMLITAGTPEKYNTMTASWGGMGVLWNKDVAFIVVRPQRYTREFIEEQEEFSLSFFLNGYREELSLCGKKSGREIDKAAACGLTPTFDYGAPVFEQADIALVCRKLYVQDMQSDCFIDKAVDAAMYPGKDYHRIYVGEIVKALKK